MKNNISLSSKRRKGKQLVCKQLFILIVFFASASCLEAQDLANIQKQKAFRLTGGLNVQSQLYHVSGIDPRQQPFYGALSGSPTLHLYGLQIPFFILLSNQERRFQQPFNQLGITPYYKWAKGYLGYNQVRFSPYTLAGRRFLGAGVELNPGKLRVGFVKGRFQRAIAESSPNQPVGPSFLSAIPIPAYDRKGYAAKLGVGGTRNYVDLSMLYAQDDPLIPVSDSVKAQENLAFGLGFQFQFFSFLKWKTEAGLSAFTRNQESELIPIPEFPFSKTLENLFPPRFSTQIRTALESSLAFQTKAVGLRLQYKRIDKDYRSMGAFYFLTDVEEWSLAPSLNLAKNRFRLNGTIGIQQDNLNKSKAQTTRRLIGSGQLSWQPRALFGVNMQYANYGLSQNPVARSISDTTRLEQVNQNLTIIPRLSFVKPNRVQTISMVLGYHALSDQSTGISYSSELTSFFANLNYHISLPQNGWGFQFGLNEQRVQLSQNATESLGGNVGFTKTSNNGNLSLNANYAYFHNRFEQVANGSTQSFRLTSHWKIQKNHGLQLQMRHLIHHASQAGSSPSFSESQGTFSYHFYFN
jgi:hypothetical protein